MRWNHNIIREFDNLKIQIYAQKVTAQNQGLDGHENGSGFNNWFGFRENEFILGYKLQVVYCTVTYTTNLNRWKELFFSFINNVKHLDLTTMFSKIEILLANKLLSDVNS